MNLNPPRSVRAVLYLVGTLGIIGVQWANDKHWLDSPDRTALAGVLALIMALATANTFTPEAPAAAAPRRRNDAGRIRPLLALSLALAMAITGALLTFASPAQAAGWSGFKCDDQSKSNAAKVCVDIHSVPSGTGLRVDQVEMCAYKVPQLYYNGFRGTKGNEIEFSGSGGVFLGYVLLPNTDTSVGGTCVYTNISFQLGKGACSRTYGTLNLSANDDYFSIQQKVLGGVC